jgi:hypothetical protein
MNGAITIYDTTLRDGAQGEGVSFSVEDKVKIAQRLDELSHTLTRLDNLADAGDWLVNYWRKLLAVFAFVVVVLEVITRILVVWPLR